MNPKFNYYDADSWDYRIMAKEHKCDVWFDVHEVYYKDGKPICYSEKSISLLRTPLKEITNAINSVAESVNKPIIWYGDRFPEEYKELYYKK